MYTIIKLWLIFTAKLYQKYFLLNFKIYMSLHCTKLKAMIESSSQSSTFSSKQSQLSYHLVSLELMKENPNTAWVFAVPSINVKHKQCDHVSEEFRKAGIGHCMSGIRSSITYHHSFCKM